MPTTAEYLSDLTSQKSALAETLSNAGVEAQASETFDTLVPKVAEATVNAKKYAHDIFSNALKGRACGENIAVNDVSPVEHNLKITAESYNLLPFPYDIPGNDYTTVLENGGIAFSTHENSSGILGTFTVKAGTYTVGAIFSITADSMGGYVNLTVSDVNGKTGNALASLKSNSSGSYAVSFTVTRQTEIKVAYTLKSTPMADADGNIIEWSAEYYPMIIRGTAAAADIAFKPYFGTGEGVTVNRYGKNLFDKETVGILEAYFQNIEGNPIISHDKSRTAYMRCLPETTYTISKTESKRFAVGTTTELPAIGVAVNSPAIKNTDTSYTITTNETAEYLLVWYYNSGVDTIAESEILDSIQVETGDTATDFEPFTKQTAVAGENGTVEGLTSLYPSMTLFTDTDNTAIDLEYNRDINKAFAGLYEQISAATAE